jgi:hypothetical protein
VLLARLEGEDIAAVSRGVCGLADDASRHAPDELGARRQEAVVRAAEGEVVPGCLSLPDGDRAPVATGRLEHAEGERVDMRDWQRLGIVRGGR